MAYAFSRTLRALALDRSGSPVWLVVATSLVVIGWLIWFFAARVTLYEVTPNARLEVDRAAHPIATTISGRVVSTSLVLGQSVVAGQILVELDAEVEKRKLEQEQQRLAALRSELEAVHRQLGDEERILVTDAQVAHSALDIARVLRAQGESATGFAVDEVRHLSKAVGSVSEIELLRAQGEEEKRRFNHTALTLEVVRLESDTQRRGAENLARYEKLRRDAVNLEGQINSTASLLKVLENDIERHKLRAPASGRVGDVLTLPIGAVLHDGERLGVVVPEGELKIVADLSPAALGRVREGQAARLRLDGFSWLQYGSLEARVTKLGSEARDGRVRVELDVSSTGSQVPLQHGLPGSLEIEVERVAPAILVLRAVGGIWARPAELEGKEVLP
jgi:multidrug resistance efflux pump